MDHMGKVHKLLDSGIALKRKGEFKDAIGEFSRAIIVINLIFKTENFDREGQLMFVKDIQIPCFLKLCACYLKIQENVPKVVILCSEVLEIDANNSKAFFYRARAYEIMKEFEKALKDVAAAREIQSGSAKLREFQTELRKKKRTVSEVVNIKMTQWTVIGKSFLLLCKRRK